MRTIINSLIVLSLLLCQETEAASTPFSLPHHLPTLDTGSKNAQLSTPYYYVPSKKIGFIKKLQYKFLQKGLRQLSRKLDEGAPTKTNVLSIISLITGLLAMIGVLAGVGALALIGAPIAIITGIIALGKKYNNTKGSRAAAITGVVLGGVVFLLILVVIIAISSWGLF